MTDTQKTTSNDSTEAELDAASLSAIRSILTEDTAPAPRGAAPSGADVAAPVEKPARRRRKADALPRLKQPIADPEAEARAAEKMAQRGPRHRESFVGGLLSRVTDRLPALPKRSAPPAQTAAPVTPQPQEPATGLRGYRPKPAYIVLALAALLIFMRPWLVLGLVLLFAFITVGVFLITGYDGFWQGVIRTARWYARRRPSRADAIHARLDRFAVRWDAFLDKFPEGTVDGLYLPDFGAIEAADRRHGEALERRLAGMQENGT